MLSVSAAQLDAILPAISGTRTLEKFVAPLNATFRRYVIDTKVRAAAFIAQVGHESGEFQYTIENLNYSAKALRRVFRRYFTLAEAEGYARQPARIANRVYANRMGNGDEASGDGWRFRGRGLIQLTGRNNVTAFARSMGMTLEEAIDYLETTDGAVMSAGWFWNSRGLNAVADGGDFVRLTELINGGTNGLPHRRQLHANALRVLA